MCSGPINRSGPCYERSKFAAKIAAGKLTLSKTQVMMMMMIIIIIMRSSS